MKREDIFTILHGFSIYSKENQFESEFYLQIEYNYTFTNNSSYFQLKLTRLCGIHYQVYIRIICKILGIK